MEDRPTVAPAPKDSRWLTMQEVADRLGLSLRTVQRMRSSGELTVSVVRSRVRVSAAELERVRQQGLERGKGRRVTSAGRRRRRGGTRG